MYCVLEIKLRISLKCGRGMKGERRNMGLPRNESLAMELTASNPVRKAVSHFHKLEKLRQVGSGKEVAARRRQKVEKPVAHACKPVSQ